MKFALLSLALALALLAPASLAFEDEADAEFFDDDDDAPMDDATEEDEADNGEVEKTSDPCSPSPHTVRKTLGGKEISQVIVKLMTHRGCQRVLEGSTPEEYTLADGCSRCSSGSGSYHCVGAPLAFSSECDLVLGPDCQTHSVDKSDHAKACES